MSSDDDSSIDSLDVPQGVTSVYTAKEMLFEGLKLAGLDAEAQKAQPKSNLQDYVDLYGSRPEVLAVIWVDLQSTTYERARVPREKLNLDYFHMTHHYLRQYPTESERRFDYLQVSRRKQTHREWVWYYVEKIRALKQQKFFIPRSHIDGDDIWIATLDGTMFSSWEIAGETRAKDPAMFSFKHQSAGFNAEVAISIKESRCIWINGPGKAGENSDLHLFQKEGGFREVLHEIGKKVIADGGYRGQQQFISTPNSHDSASVRKFKSRALKRHEAFNGMIKKFRCLSDKFRHTADKDAERWISCFEAVVVICQYHLENGSPLYNIYVGDM